MTRWSGLLQTFQRDLVATPATTVYAFDQSVDLREASGWWSNVHWKVIRSREGKPLLLVAQKKKALAVAQTALQAPPVSGPG